MPFKAMRRSDQRPVFTFDYQHPRIELAGEDFECPFCGAEMRIRGGMSRRYHFYHVATCTGNIEYKPGQHGGGGESDAHLRIKMELFHKLKTQDRYGEQVEYRVEEAIKTAGVFRIADVAAILKATGEMITAYEIQLSPISIDQLEARTQAYAQCDIDTVWILGDKAATLTNIEWCTWNMGLAWKVVEYDFTDQVHQTL